MKSFKKLVAIVLAAATVSCAGMLTACGEAEKGDKGDKGEQGIQGIQGLPGKDGVTPQIGANGNWFIGNKDTGVKAEGTNGATPTISIDADGYWVINGVKSEVKAAGTNGATPTISIDADGYWVINGVKSEIKAQGSNGQDGATPTISIDKDGYWVINGVKSEVKAAGTNGQDGATPTISIDKDGYWVINGVKSEVKAKGTDGKNPVVSINSDGYWVIDGAVSDVKAQGVMGTVWFTGRGLPSAQDLSAANEGDFYINLNTNTIYTFEGGAWRVLVNVNEQRNISKWDGKIPGWQAPNLSDAEIIKNRPVSYVVDESNKVVDLYNAEAFAWFAYRAIIGKTGYEGYTVNLHCDIDLDNKLWIPIGLGARSNAAGIAFRGTFNGNGHTIYNLNGDAFVNAIQYGEYDNILGVDEPTKANGYYINYVNGDVDVNIPIHCKDDESGDEVIFGLFGNSCNATFKNLNIEGVTLSTTSKDLRDDGRRLLVDSVGALLGYGLGSLTVENCTTGNPDGSDSIKVYTTAAGLVGRVYAGMGVNPKSGVIDGTQLPYGKIKIENCTNYINVELDGAKLDKVAGIIAFPNRFAEVIIDNCDNYGNIKGGYAGGIIGYSDGKVDMESPVSISDCSNHGNVTGNYAGGLMGYRGSVSGGSNASYTVNNFINHGDITAERVCAHATSKSLYAGGLAGYFTTTSTCGVFTECYNHGDVTVKDAETATNYAGGLFGYVKVIKSTVAGKKQGNVIISGINMGDVSATVKNGGAVKVYGFGFVDIASGLTPNAVYKQIYYFNSGLLSIGETAVTDKENTNLEAYATGN